MDQKKKVWFIEAKEITYSDQNNDMSNALRIAVGN